MSGDAQWQWQREGQVPHNEPGDECHDSIGMVAVTLAVFAVPPLWGETLQRALLRAMTFMIVASPCAVVLATMPPLLAAIANAGRSVVRLSR